ncbi:MAG: hypothetical protein J0L92_32710 [Deltaproteobacteria bacterium]|nr:hypothetical protein [Deltaproteobacteria bacterium]
MTFADSSTLLAARRRARVGLLSDALGVSARELAKLPDELLAIHAELVLTRWGYVYREPGEWQVRRRFLSLWAALRAHVERFRAIEARLVAETEWRMRRAAA